VSSILCALITVFIVVVFARVILSWFPLKPGSGLAQVNGILHDLTEWALRPLRRIIPPVGMLDLSVLVLTVGLFVVRGFIC
jgi:YggT family protein